MPLRRLVWSLHALRIPFHAVALAADLYVGWWVLKNCEPHTWPGHLAMLTHWGHLLQTIYLAIVLFQDFAQLVSWPGSFFSPREFCVSERRKFHDAIDILKFSAFVLFPSGNTI